MKRENKQWLCALFAKLISATAPGIKMVIINGNLTLQFNKIAQDHCIRDK